MTTGRAPVLVLCGVVAALCIGSSAVTRPEDERLAALFRAQLQGAVIAYAGWLPNAADPATRALRDPHGTLDGEGYGPACGALVVAVAYPVEPGPR